MNNFLYVSNNSSIFAQDSIKNTMLRTSFNRSKGLRVVVEIGCWPAILFFINFLGFVFLELSPVCERRGLVLLAGVLYMVTCITDNSLSSPALFLFIVIVMMISKKSSRFLAVDEENRRY